MNQGLGETETKSVSVFVLQSLQRCIYNAMDFYLKVTITYLFFFPPIMGMHAYVHSLFSLWSFHLFTKCFALLNILTISLDYFVARNKCAL